jgi:hypothetical protein
LTYVLHPEGTPARDPQDLAFLDHLAERHGLRTIDCPEHAGGGCRRCNGHGVLYSGWTEEACEPDCTVPARMELLRRRKAS